MKKLLEFAGVSIVFLSSMAVPRAAAQVPVLVPLAVDTAAPIIVNAVKPKPKPNGLAKFEG